LLTRAENKKKMHNLRRSTEIQHWEAFLATVKCLKCDVTENFRFGIPERGCNCPSHSNNRWLWVYSETGLETLKKIVFCTETYALIYVGSELDGVRPRIYRNLWAKHQHEVYEVSPSFTEMTYWTRQMAKRTPLHAALHHLLKQLLHESGVCDFVFSFLAFPAEVF
jgi:hypothetical protein